MLALCIACGGGDQFSTTTPSTSTTRSRLATPTIARTATLAPTIATPSALLIRNGTLIDGTGAAPVANAFVVVKGDRIAEIGSGEPAVPPEATVIDARGGTIMPGLIDTHVHITRRIVPRNPSGQPGIDPEGLLPWLHAGITTLRDVGTAPEAFPPVKQFVDGQARIHKAPRVIWAGPIVTTTGGYPIPVPPYALVAQEVASVDEARQTTNKLADGGAGVIKLGLEKGYYADEGWPLLTLEEVTAIAETAHARGLRVTAHVTSMDELRLALDGGVDDLAHAPLEPIPDDLLQRMLQEQIGMATTATVWGGPGASQQAAANAKRYADAGGIVSVATDFGCCDQIPGLEPYLQEMQFLLGAGMTPMQLLVATTNNGAILANLGDQVGTIEPGKIADIIVVAGNPLSDIRALNNVVTVVQGGEEVTSR